MQFAGLGNAKTATQAIAGAIESRAPGEISTVLSRLDSAISRLSEMASGFVNRLEPVFAPAAPEIPRGKEEAQYCTELGSKIAADCRELETVADMLAEANRRLSI